MLASRRTIWVRDIYGVARLWYERSSTQGNECIITSDVSARLSVRTGALLSACWQIEIRIAEVVNEIAHHKEKEQWLAESIESEEHELDEHHERTVRIREDVNELYLILRDLRRGYEEKRRDAGLLMAQ